MTSFSGSLSCAPLTVPEGDVTGVMERPVGNTAEVYMECEKWYQYPPAYWVEQTIRC